MRANTELNQGSITTRTVSAAAFHRMDVSCLCPQKARPALLPPSPPLLTLCPQIYHSKQFQVCTHPASFTPADLKSICRSMPAATLDSLQARSLIWSGWHTQLYPEAVIGLNPYNYFGCHFLSSIHPLLYLHLPKKHQIQLQWRYFFLCKISKAHRQWLIFISSREPPTHPLTRSCGFHNTVAAWLKQRSPDRSITNLHSQQSVTDSMPTKPLAIHY